MGLSIPYYFEDYTAKNNVGPIQTGSALVNDVLNSIFQTAAAVSLMLTLLLDNTVPGSDQERGLHVWRCLVTAKDGTTTTHWWEDDHMNRVRLLHA